MARREREHAAPRLHGARVADRAGDRSKCPPAFWRTTRRAASSVARSARRSSTSATVAKSLSRSACFLEGISERRCRPRILLEDLLVELRRVGAAIDALGRELRHLDPDFATGWSRLHRRRLALEQLVERLVRAPLRVELLQLLDGLRVARRCLHELLVGLDRVLDVRELLEPSPRDGAVKLGLRAGVRLQLAEPRLRGEQIAPAAERLVDARELAERPRIGRIERGDLREDSDERRVALRVLAIDLRDVAKHRQGAPARRLAAPSRAHRGADR